MRKRNFKFKKSFNEVGAYSYDTKVSLPGQKGWAWVQLLPHQKLSNSKIALPEISVEIWMPKTI